MARKTPRIHEQGPATVAATFAELSEILGGRWSRDLPGLASTYVRELGAGFMVGHYGDTLVEAYPDRVVVRAPRTVSSAARVARFSPVRLLSDSTFGGWRFSFAGVEYWTPRGVVEIVETADGCDVNGAITRNTARALGKSGRAALFAVVSRVVVAAEVRSWVALAGTADLALALVDMTPKARDMVAPLMANGLTPADAIACAPAVTR